jgi:hypothetical protein
MISFYLGFLLDTNMNSYNSNYFLEFTHFLLIIKIFFIYWKLTDELTSFYFIFVTKILLLLSFIFTHKN